MKSEKIILSFIAIVIGILVAGVGFYLYQSTKTVKITKTISITPAPTSPAYKKSSLFLSIDYPVNEEVTDKKVITVSGKTIPDATVLISTPSEDDVVTPTKTGNFSTSMLIQDDENQIEITAIAPSGEETKAVKTVTFSTEDF